MNLRRTAAVLGVACLAAGGCKHRWDERPGAPPRLERHALTAAKRSASIAFDCRELTPTTLSARDTMPAKVFTVRVEGCGRSELFEVTCANGVCTADR